MLGLELGLLALEVVAVEVGYRLERRHVR